MRQSTKHPGLVRAVRALQSGRDGQHAEMAVVWPAIVSQTRLQRCRDHADDVAQHTALKLMRASAPFKGETDEQAFTWLGTVVRNTLRDALRKERPQQIGRVGRHADDERDPLDAVAGAEPDVWQARAQLLLELLDGVRGEIEHQISESGLPIIRRELRWKQAEATLLARVEGEAATEIAIAVGAPSASSAAVHKWVERGLPFVLEAIAALAQQANPEEGIVLQRLHAKLAERRADAGKPRPARRRTPSKPPAKRKPSKPPPKATPKKARPKTTAQRVRGLVSRERAWASVQIRWMKPGEARVATRRAVRTRRRP